MMALVKRFSAIAIVVMLTTTISTGLLAGCSGSSSSSSSTASSSEAAQSSEGAALEVELTAEPVDADGKTAFQISTNLPDETELMLTLDGKTTSYTGQTKVTVVGGSAASESFSKDGAALPSGDYTLTVSMSLPKLQSDTVRAVIGTDGENITGQYVEKATIGDANVVRAQFDIKL